MKVRWIKQRSFKVLKWRYYSKCVKSGALLIFQRITFPRNQFSLKIPPFRHAIFPMKHQLPMNIIKHQLPMKQNPKAMASQRFLYIRKIKDTQSNQLPTCTCLPQNAIHAYVISAHVPEQYITFHFHVCTYYYLDIYLHLLFETGIHWE